MRKKVSGGVGGGEAGVVYDRQKVREIFGQLGMGGGAAWGWKPVKFRKRWCEVQGGIRNESSKTEVVCGTNRVGDMKSRKSEMEWGGKGLRKEINYLKQRNKDDARKYGMKDRKRW